MNGRDKPIGRILKEVKASGVDLHKELIVLLKTLMRMGGGQAVYVRA
jgi:hypothetical protein